MNATVTQYKTRDKYGRTVQHFSVNGKTVAVLVTMPKPYVELTGNKYLVNDWASETRGDVHEFAKRADGVKKAGEIVARETAKLN
jgi:hypothetical protein